MTAALQELSDAESAIEKHSEESIKTQNDKFIELKDAEILAKAEVVGLKTFATSSELRRWEKEIKEIHDQAYKHKMRKWKPKAETTNKKRKFN